MSIEQRRITRLKKKKIAKFQKLVKNKAAEFKRKVDLLRLIMQPIGGGKFGANLTQIISHLEKNGISNIDASAIESILAPDLLSGKLVRLVKGEGENPGDISYRVNKK